MALPLMKVRKSHSMIYMQNQIAVIKLPQQAIWPRLCSIKILFATSARAFGTMTRVMLSFNRLCSRFFDSSESFAWCFTDISDSYSSFNRVCRLWQCILNFQLAPTVLLVPVLEQQCKFMSAQPWRLLHLQQQTCFSHKLTKPKVNFQNSNQESMRKHIQINWRKEVFVLEIH